MPIYKIARRGDQERRERFVHGRIRLVTLLVSSLLFLATAVLLLNYVTHRPV